ncbi:MAG: transglycosylase domain-containing protein [Elusimicrobiota bacterium]
MNNNSRSSKPSKYARIIYSSILILMILTGIFLRHLISELPPIENMQQYNPNLTTRFYDVNNKIISELYIEHRVYVPLSEIPVDLQNAVIATEDHLFYKHWGLNFSRIIKSAVLNIISGRVGQGGSTITQQLAKVMFLTHKRTMTRKIKELFLAIRLEIAFTKQEILEMYLNQIYFGANSYGVESASRAYFGKPVQSLNLAECALLAGLIRRPGSYSPFSSVDRATKRRETVLYRMKTLNLIDKKMLEDSKAYPIQTVNLGKTGGIGAYFIEYLRQQLDERYGTDMINRGGLKVYTTLNLEAQMLAETVMEEKLLEYEVTHGTGTLPVQGSLVVIDPVTGQIRAMIGGRSFKKSQFNRATQARRQAGSAFKLFVFTAAIENGITPADTIDDSAATYKFNGHDWEPLDMTVIQDTTTVVDEPINPLLENLPKDLQKPWSPKNYRRKYYGKITVRKALEQSLNVSAVKLTRQISPQKVVQAARKLGIKSHLQANLSIALGTNEVTLIELTNAFGVIANHGIRAEPYGITKVETHDGRVLEENVPMETEVLSAQTSFIVGNMLKGVIDRGTGYKAHYIERPAAGKTGTTNNYTDAWFVGFTPDLVCGIWVGYDDCRSLGSGMTGGELACPIWTKFMKDVLKDKPIQNFTVPDRIVFAKVDPKTGLLALPNTPKAHLESFLRGTEPKMFSLNTDLLQSTTAEDEIDQELGF